MNGEEVPATLNLSPFVPAKVKLKGELLSVSVTASVPAVDPLTAASDS